jgi:SAM-dependent methyltransferase
VSSGVDPRWYEGFFGDDWLTIARTVEDPERTTHQVDFVVDTLGLEPGARILDLACGHGRHALELARRGYRVTGLDLSEPSLALARENAAAVQLELGFVRGDMRDLPWESEFEAVLNMFTAFGYFEDEQDDQRVLEQVARVLRPGGSFLLDTLSLFVLARGFQPRDWQELEDGRLLLEDRAYDALAGRSTATWTLLAPGGGRSELRHSLRVYTLPELRTMLAKAGLETIAAWGGWEGEEYGFEGSRLILHARRRA